MNSQLSSIPKMIRETGNAAEVARALNVSRNTVRKYKDDHGCHRHIVVGGVLMSETADKRKKAGS